MMTRQTNTRLMIGWRSSCLRWAFRMLSCLFKHLDISVACARLGVAFVYRCFALYE